MLVSTSRRQGRAASLQLPGRVWVGSVPIEPIRRLGTGVQSFDALLDGGIPRGRLSEIVGAPSSGCSALMGALLAAATRRGEITAVVDLPDALYPRTLSAVGTDLDRVLWVRPPSLQTSLKCAELILTAGGFGLAVLDLNLPGIHRLPPHVWPRFIRAAKQTGTTFVVLAHHRIADSAATISVNLTLQRARWNRRLFEGVTTRATLMRNKLGAPGRTVALAISNQPRTTFSNE